MAEIKTPPFREMDKNGDEVVCFASSHTLADIVRWLMENRAAAAEVHRMLGEELNQEGATGGNGS